MPWCFNIMRYVHDVDQHAHTPYETYKQFQLPLQVRNFRPAWSQYVEFKHFELRAEAEGTCLAFKRELWDSDYQNEMVRFLLFSTLMNCSCNHEF